MSEPGQETVLLDDAAVAASSLQEEPEQMGGEIDQANPGTDI